MTNSQFTQHITESADFKSLVARPLPEYDMNISVYWGEDADGRDILLGVNFFMGVDVAPNDPNLTTFFDHMQENLYADEKLTKFVNLMHEGKNSPTIKSIAEACVVYPQFEELFSTEPSTESTSDRIEYYASVYDLVQRNHIWEKASRVLGDSDADLHEYSIDEAIDAIQAIYNEELLDGYGDGDVIVSKANWQKEKDGYPIQVEFLNAK